LLKHFRKLGFTGFEYSVFIILVLVFITGWIIKLFKWKPEMDYSYNSQDSLFERKADEIFKNLKTEAATNDKADIIKKINDSLLSLEENKSLRQDKKIQPGQKIDLNKAYEADLMLLPGIGEVTAERIIEYREKNSGFRSINELLNIKGIGEKKFGKIKDYITVE
jgi:comEA protein